MLCSDCPQRNSLENEIRRVREDNNRVRVLADKEIDALQSKLEAAEAWANEQIDDNFKIYGAHSGYLSKREHFIPAWMGGPA